MAREGRPRPCPSRPCRRWPGRSCRRPRCCEARDPVGTGAAAGGDLPLGAAPFLDGLHRALAPELILVRPRQGIQGALPKAHGRGVGDGAHALILAVGGARLGVQHEADVHLGRLRPVVLLRPSLHAGVARLEPLLVQGVIPRLVPALGLDAIPKELELAGAEAYRVLRGGRGHHPPQVPLELVPIRLGAVAGRGVAQFGLQLDEALRDGDHLRVRAVSRAVSPI